MTKVSHYIFVSSSSVCFAVSNGILCVFVCFSHDQPLCVITQDSMSVSDVGKQSINLCLSVCLSLSVCLCLSVCLSLSVSLSLSLSLSLTDELMNITRYVCF